LNVLRKPEFPAIPAYQGGRFKPPLLFSFKLMPKASTCLCSFDACPLPCKEGRAAASLGQVPGFISDHFLKTVFHDMPPIVYISKEVIRLKE
jgi:hypothetical protein